MPDLPTSSLHRHGTEHYVVRSVFASDPGSQVCGEALELTAFVGSLAAEPGMLAPRFFLASILQRDWKPRVVVVSQGRRIAGLLYCKERVVAGIGTRIAFGDDT